MSLNTLLAVTAEDGRYTKITQQLSPYVSEFGLMKYRVFAESIYLVLLSEKGVVRKFTEEETVFITGLSEAMTIVDGERIQEIESKTNHDVNAMIQWIKEKLEANGLGDVVEKVHYLLTSEDINNLAYRLQIAKACKKILFPKIRETLLTLLAMTEKYVRIPMLARTHGQPAIPTTIGKELANFSSRLTKEYVKLVNFSTYSLTGKMNGAVGNYNAHSLLEKDVDWFDFSKEYVSRLGLKWNPMTTQINPSDDIIEFFQILERINNIFIDFAQDTWRYISDDWFKQKPKEGEVGSSTMAQKVNPIDFENAEGNFGVANTLIDFFVRKLPISRLQRDLSDSTVLRRIGTILSDSLIGFVKINAGLKKVSPNEAVISEALNRNWAILSEPVQLMLRKKTDLDDPYDLVKKFIRGKMIGEQDYRSWIESLNLDDDVRDELLNLTLETYIGLAPELTNFLLSNTPSLLYE